jgi:hypothetical protein
MRQLLRRVGRYYGITSALAAWMDCPKRVVSSDREPIVRGSPLGPPTNARCWTLTRRIRAAAIANASPDAVGEHQHLFRPVRRTDTKRLRLQRRAYAAMVANQPPLRGDMGWNRHGATSLAIQGCDLTFLICSRVFSAGSL